MYMYYFLGHQLMDNPSLTDAQKEVSRLNTLTRVRRIRWRDAVWRWEQKIHFCLLLMETSTSSRRPLSRWVRFACNIKPSAGGRLDETEPRCGSCLWKNPSHGKRLHAVVLILQRCMWKLFHKQHHFSGTRSLSMPLDTGFRRRQSTCLAVFFAGRILR